METRILGRTGRTVSVIGLGTWQLGADWGDIDDSQARAVLDASFDAGVTMYDTADVYGDGRSEQRIGAWLDDRGLRGQVFVATKIGRRVPLEPQYYTMQNFRDWIDRSRANLGTDTLDLVQLHCPPEPVFAADEVFDALDTLVAEKAIAAYGVSVETVGQALSSIARPGVASVQIVFNAFRLKPLDEVLPAAQDAGVGIIARVPLASGLLSGRYDHDTTFAPDDHRTYNRMGLARERGLEPATAALAWLAQLPGVSTVIPGARNVGQAQGNAAAGSVAPLGPDFTAAVRDLYDRRIRASVHDRW
jgi:aryl-alcohol dehydrogenase-like predicted oxidoreductase